MNEVYLKPLGRLIVSGVTTFFLAASADLAGSGNMGLPGLSSRIVLGAFILFQLVLGLCLWPENMMSEWQAGELRSRWLILVTLDVSCLVIGSLTTAIYLLPRPIRAPLRGLTVEYLAFGASLQAFVYLVFLVSTGWLVLRSRSQRAEGAPRARQRPRVPERPQPVPRAQGPATASPAARANRSQSAWRLQVLAAVLAGAVTSMSIMAGWYGRKPFGIAVAVAATAAAALAAARNTGR